MKLKLCTVIALGMLCGQVQAADNTAMMPGQTAQSSDAQAGEAFLNKNKAKPGVVTLDDGLQYKVMTKGSGPKPSDSDVVSVDYTGTFINGEEFDSSSKHGGAVSFPVGQVIPGWTEALKLMTVGSTWMLYIPSNLAYGEQGAPPSIGPNQTLVFKVTLLSIKKNA